MSKPICLCDVDGVLADLTGYMMNVYNEKYNENVTYDMFTSWNVGEVYKKCTDNPFIDLLSDEDIATLPVIEGCKEYITKIKEMTDFYICTNIHPRRHVYRHQWLSKNFKWYCSDMLISCKDKYLIKGNILIDDYFYNHSANRDISILVSQPWNSEHKDTLLDNMIRTNDYERMYYIVKDYSNLQKYKKVVIF